MCVQRDLRYGDFVPDCVLKTESRAIYGLYNHVSIASVVDTSCYALLYSNDVPRVPVSPATTVIPSLHAGVPAEATPARSASWQYCTGAGPWWSRCVPTTNIPFSCRQYTQVCAPSSHVSFTGSSGAKEYLCCFLV